MNYGRFRFELGGPSNGLSLLPNQTEEVQPSANELWPIKHQNQNCPYTKPEPNQHADSLDTTQTNNLGGRVGDLRTFELLTLGPCPPLLTSPITPPSQSSNLNSSNNASPKMENVTSIECARKRVRIEIGKFGRNIRQRLCCGHFERDSTQNE